LPREYAFSRINVQERRGRGGKILFIILIFSSPIPHAASEPTLYRSSIQLQSEITPALQAI